jgi:hypothetical protein
MNDDANDEEEEQVREGYTYQPKKLLCLMESTHHDAGENSCADCHFSLGLLMRISSVVDFARASKIFESACIYVSFQWNENA